METYLALMIGVPLLFALLVDLGPGQADGESTDGEEPQEPEEPAWMRRRGIRPRGHYEPEHGVYRKREANG